MHIYIYIYRPLACTGQWPNKPAEIASDEAAMRYRCSWKDLKDMALWTVLTHDACGMVYFVLTYTYALELIANVSRSSSRIRRRHERRQLNKILGMKSRLREWGEFQGFKSRRHGPEELEDSVKALATAAASAKALAAAA